MAHRRAIRHVRRTNLQYILLSLLTERRFSPGTVCRPPKKECLEQSPKFPKILPCKFSEGQSQSLLVASVLCTNKQPVKDDGYLICPGCWLIFHGKNAIARHSDKYLYNLIIQQQGLSHPKNRGLDSVRNHRGLATHDSLNNGRISLRQNHVGLTKSICFSCSSS